MKNIVIFIMAWYNYKEKYVWMKIMETKHSTEIKRSLNVFKKVELVEAKNAINQPLERGRFSENLPGIAPFLVH